MALGQRGFFSPVQIPNCTLWLDATDASKITQVAAAQPKSEPQGNMVDIDSMPDEALAGHLTSRKKQAQQQA